MKKLFFILTLGLLIASCQKSSVDTLIETEVAESVTSSSVDTLGASILSVVVQSDGKYKITWTASVTTQPHTFHWKVWFGKNRNASTKLHNFYVWSYSNPNNGPIELNGSRIVDFSLWDKNWKEANIIGYICEYNYIGSPYDQYNCKDAIPTKVYR